MSAKQRKRTRDLRRKTETERDNKIARDYRRLQVLYNLAVFGSSVRDSNTSPIAQISVPMEQGESLEEALDRLAAANQDWFYS